MTKDEAIKAMQEGEKVAHNLFSPEEWMTIKDMQILFEDGCMCFPNEFWIHRDDSH